MTGDAPQPGETPRDEVDPWSFADPGSSWWHTDDQTGQPRRPAAPAAAQAAAQVAGPPTLAAPKAAQHTGPAADAHQAGAQDTLAALTGEPPPPAVTAMVKVPRSPVPPVIREPAPRPAEPRGVEHDHDRVDAERFNTEGDGTAYAARDHAEPPAGPGDREPTIVDVLNSIPLEPRSAAHGEPETDRNRPTVALDLSVLPGQPPNGLSRLGHAPQDRARADRALQDRARQERTSALLETSAFWQAGEDRRAPAQDPPVNAGRPPRRRVRPPRRPVSGLLGLLVLGLVAAFFAWVSAEPFWLAVGHGDRGTATVTRCSGAGVTQRCAGQFTAADGAYQVDGVALFGVEPAQRTVGSVVPARMVSSDSRQAYVGGPGKLMHLRWALSFVLVLLCGIGIAVLTGVRRLDSVRARRGALVLSVAGPLALLAGFLFVTY